MFELWSVVASSLAVGWQQLVTILLLMFGLFMLLAGLFTAYFGSGKSRMIGYALLGVGLVVFLASGYWYHAAVGGLGTLIWLTFLIVIAAVVGAVLAVGIFLVAIMKS